MIQDEEISKSFYSYVDEKLLKRLNAENVYTLPVYLDGVDAENTFQELVCKYLANEINKIFDFEQIKEDYQDKCRRIHPNLSYNKLQKRKNELDKGLMTYVKLKYCLDQVENFGYGLVVADYLYIILTKRSLKYKKERDIPNELIDYLFFTTLEKYYKNLIEEKKKSFETAVNGLFREIVKTNTARNNTVLEEFISSQRERIIVPTAVLTLDKEDDNIEVINKVEKEIYYNLVDEMHTINGKYF